jgi:hypothetical protein
MIKLAVLASSALATALAAAFGAAGIAHADPTVGQQCTHAQMNTTAQADDGSQLQCMSVPQAGFMWLPATGHLQQDPAIAGQAGWAACMSVPGNTAADCRCLVDGNC